MHGEWPEPPPATLALGESFRRQVAIMGMAVELVWPVAELEPTRAWIDGVSPTGVRLSLVANAPPLADGARLYLDVGMSGEPPRGAVGASAQRAAREVRDESIGGLAPLLGGADVASGPVLHERTGVSLPANTPVIVGVGQVARRDADGHGSDPVALSAEALHEAARDAGDDALLGAADAVYAVASLSWQYRDQAALIAAAVGARPERTVVSARIGGDSGQRMLNAAAEAIADGRSQVILVSGAEAGATLGAAQKAGITPAWPEQDDSARPTEVVGIDREGSNSAEIEVGLAAPIYVYSLIESAIRAKTGELPDDHQARITALWSRFSEIGAHNPHAWLPTAHTPEELAPSATNRMVSAPYPKLLCANLAVDLASAAIVCSAAAAQTAGIPQDRWVFPHAGAAAHDEWFISERADLAASPAIRAIGRSVLEHAGVSIDDVGHVDLYSCFPSAVQVAAAELGLPLDDPTRPLTVTGGLTWAGGPGNNYGGHGVAAMVATLREDPEGYGLTTSLGWYLTKHAAALYSATPPSRPYADLHPIVEQPPSRPVRGGYTGPAVLEAYTVPYGRDGEPQAAVLTTLTPDGARALVRSTQPEIIDALLSGEGARRAISVQSATEVTLGAETGLALPPPPRPVLVDRHARSR